jgi:ribosome recycling factor
MIYSKKNFTSKLGEALDFFKAELAKLRTGRANPALLEDLPVDYYGTKTPLKQMASVTTPEPRAFLVQPWDKGSLQDVVKAIQTSDLGLNPSTEGEKIRILLPPLTEETRLAMVKTVKEKSEEAKIAIRNLREEEIEKLEAEGLSEDVVEKSKQEIQESVNDYNQQIAAIMADKEKDIMTV